MADLQILYVGWESIYVELQCEYDSICTAAQVEGLVSRQAVAGMDLEDAKIFYTAMLDSVKLHAYLDLFAWYEKFLFEDLKKRLQGCSSSFCVYLMQEENHNISTLLKVWRKFDTSPGMDVLYNIVENARNWRNYAAHGQRYTPPSSLLPALEDVYAAIALLVEHQQQI